MPAPNATHILVVDDDAKMRRLLRRCLESENCLVSEAANSAEVMQTLAEQSINLITLDLNLGPEDGLDIAREVGRTHDVPIVMVTGKGDVIDRVVGLELGADDYITKPFHVREVQARIKMVLRRAEVRASHKNLHQAELPGSTANNEECFGFDGWHLDIARRELRSPEGQPVDLTSSEFDLLHIFVRHPRHALSRDQIMDALKGHDWTPTDRSIDNLVARLRRRIENDPHKPDLIKTVRGVGYSFTAEVTKT